MQDTKQAVFLLGEEEYSFDIMDIKSLEKVIPIESVESFSKNLKGIIHLRGDVIPVFSLRRKFGLEDIETDQDTRFIITTSNGFLIAYEVDRMREIVQLEGEQVHEAPALLKGGDTFYVNAITKLENSLVILLDKDNILSEDEKSEIQAVVNQ